MDIAANHTSLSNRAAPTHVINGNIGNMIRRLTSEDTDIKKYFETLHRQISKNPSNPINNENPAERLLGRLVKWFVTNINGRRAWQKFIEYALQQKTKTDLATTQVSSTDDLFKLAPNSFNEDGTLKAEGRISIYGYLNSKEQYPVPTEELCRDLLESIGIGRETIIPRTKIYDINQIRNVIAALCENPENYSKFDFHPMLYPNAVDLSEESILAAILCDAMLSMKGTTIHEAICRDQGAGLVSLMAGLKLMKENVDFKLDEI